MEEGKQRNRSFKGMLGGLVAGGLIGALVFAPAFSSAKTAVGTRQHQSGSSTSTGAASRGAISSGLTSPGVTSSSDAPSNDGSEYDSGTGSSSGTGAQPPPRPCPPGMQGDGPLRVAAETIGIAPMELAKDLHDGSTMAEVAEEYGVDPQAVIDALVADATKHIEQAVTDGHMTQDVADRLLAGLEEHITGVVNGDIPPGPPPGAGSGGPPPPPMSGGMPPGGMPGSAQQGTAPTGSAPTGVAPTGF